MRDELSEGVIRSLILELAGWQRLLSAMSRNWLQYNYTSNINDLLAERMGFELPVQF